MSSASPACTVTVDVDRTRRCRAGRSRRRSAAGCGSPRAASSKTAASSAGLAARRPARRLRSPGRVSSCGCSSARRRCRRHRRRRVGGRLARRRRRGSWSLLPSSSPSVSSEHVADAVVAGQVEPPAADAVVQRRARRSSLSSARRSRPGPRRGRRSASTGASRSSAKVTSPTWTSSGRLSRNVRGRRLGGVELARRPCSCCCRSPGRRRVGRRRRQRLGRAGRDDLSTIRTSTESGSSVDAVGRPSAWNTMRSASPFALDLDDPAALSAACGLARGSDDAERAPPAASAARRRQRHRPNFSNAKIVGSTVTPAAASFSRNLGRRPVDFRVPERAAGARRSRRCGRTGRCPAA